MQSLPVVLATFVVIAAPGFAQPADSLKRIDVVRITGAAPRLDGILNESVWRTAPAVTGLIQREPTEGAPATEATEVRFAYDEDALWVGARMHSANPAGIRALITRRDRQGSSEQIIISLDTHKDRRTAYTFSVTPAGVRLDWFHGSDNENSQDYGYDPVWEVETRIDSAGWTAEMRIPFTQLRFSPGDEQTWGVNVVRRIPDRNEDNYWVLVKRNETGWSSRMATLGGIRGIRPSRRVEILPYIAANSRLRDEVDRADPFQEKAEVATRAGADVKMGIGPNLTLDIALNPDFGQVEADPAQVNLSAYETFFSEKRPFFLEGSQLFGGRGLFYSRRIGAAPPGMGRAQRDWDYVQPIDNTTILGAAKLTGRLPSGLSVGALAAVTDREEVRTFDATTRSFGDAVVAPRTAYSVASLQQEFGKTRSTVGATVTAVRRDLDGVPALVTLLPEQAYSAIADTRIRWAGGMYDMSAYAGFAHVSGDSNAIIRLQRSPTRNFQRPDAIERRLDSTRTSLGGVILGINHSKLSGKHWLWDVDYWEESPGFEANDIGAFGAVDDRAIVGQIRYRETQPGKLFRNYNIGIGNEANWNFERMRRGLIPYMWGNVTLPNFWQVYADLLLETPGLSDRLTRGGPVMRTPRSLGFSASVNNRSGARTGLGASFGVSNNELGGWSRNFSLGFSARPGTQLEINLSPGWSMSEEARQYVTEEGGGRPETYGTRYIFARVKMNEVSARMRVNYTFTPKLTLETYLEPFAASGVYSRFGELRQPRDYDLLEYGTEGTTATRTADGATEVTDGSQTFTIDNNDYNVRSLRSNAVLRWEWRPGSTMYLVWQQDRGGNRAIRSVRPGDLFNAFNTRGDSFFAIKLSYWIPLR